MVRFYYQKPISDSVHTNTKGEDDETVIDEHTTFGILRFAGK